MATEQRGSFQPGALNFQKRNVITKRHENELIIEQLAFLPDSEIDTSDIAELGEEFWQNAKVIEPEGTTQVILRVKKSVLQTFKGTGKGYQTRMNAVMESYARTLQK